MNLKPRRIEEPEINVTSLIDVVLLLVVFFMLSSNFTAEGRLRVRLPHASSVPTDRSGNESLVISVSAAGGDRAFCTGCGTSSSECAGCGRAYDPPRFCPGCGRRLTVTVIPTGWVARCRDHAELRSA